MNLLKNKNKKDDSHRSYIYNRNLNKSNEIFKEELLNAMSYILDYKSGSLVYGREETSKKRTRRK